MKGLYIGLDVNRPRLKPSHLRIVAQPKAEIFPASGRPRCEVRIRVEGDGSAVIYRVIGFDDQTAELETLLPGDSM